VIKKKSSGFEDLEVWQKTIELTEIIYNVSRSFPVEELYGITSQMRRSAVSIASNIAEGSARKSRKDFARFTAIANGSAAELKTQLYIAHRIKILSKDDFEEAFEKINVIGKMLKGLHKHLKTINH